MRVLITGIGDAFTSRFFGSSALIEAPGGFVLLDCPDPIHRVLREATSKAGWDVQVIGIDDVIVTHLHGDHCNGLESLAFHRRILRLQDPALQRPRLHVTREVADRVWERLAPAMDAPMGSAGRSTLADYFDVHVLAPGTPSVIAGLTVECRATRHVIPTIGLKLSDATGTLGWSGDTPFEDAHVRWLADADLIVHESNLGAVHTPIESLNGLADELRRKIRLIHLPDDFDHATTDMQALRQGEVLDVVTDQSVAPTGSQRTRL